MTDLSGKVALVTGASRGIGRSIAVELAKRNAKVIVNYSSNEAKAQETAQEIGRVSSVQPVLKQFDVGDSAAVDAALTELEGEIGSVDILVNNAGIVKDGLLIRYKDEDWQRVLNTNLSGAFYCARFCARRMLKKRYGRIINVSSIVGQTGNVGQIAYVAAKSGMIGLTKALARELASRSITVNAVTPGYIETDMTQGLSDQIKTDMLLNIPLGVLGSTHDIAHAVGFLASDEARYITGQVLPVNGGMYM